MSAVRAWFAAVYALLPAATGAIAGGRLGTAVVLVLLPLIAVHAARVYGYPRSEAAALDVRTRRKRVGRAAWTVALLLAVAMSFVPLVWLIAALAAGVVWAVLDRPGRQGRRHLAVALGVPPLLMLPWTVGLLLNPSRFLTEAGLHRPFEPATAAACSRSTRAGRARPRGGRSPGCSRRPSSRCRCAAAGARCSRAGCWWSSGCSSPC